MESAEDKMIQIYVSRTNGNRMMSGEQLHIVRVLESKRIAFEEIDVGDPHCREEKQFMQQTLRLSEEDLVALPPQIFNARKYRGDYAGFFQALECERLYAYLDLEAPPSEVEHHLSQGTPPQ